MKFVFRSAESFEKHVQMRARQLKLDRRRAARIAVDRQTKKTQRAIQARMRSVGLGRLSGGVRQTSSLKKRSSDRREWGVIYASGQRNADSRTAGAIEAYTEGVTIRAKSKYLAYATSAVPRFGSGRRRMTPWLYETTGWAQRLGPLKFRQINRNMALLVIQNVTLHPKTGRAKKAGLRPPRTRIAKKETVAFILIRYTVRAQRLDEKSIAGVYYRQMPEAIAEALAEIRSRRAGG